MRHHVVVVLLAFASAPTVFGQGPCQSFTGTAIYTASATDFSDPFKGVAYISIGGAEPIKVSVVFVDGGTKKNLTNVSKGWETAEMTFPDGRKLRLTGPYTLQHMTNPTGVFTISESGVITTSGTPAVIIGHYTNHAVWGPGVSPDPALWWSVATYNGSICSGD